jgi:F-type H+-transporting ATPase subunit b
MMSRLLFFVVLLVPAFATAAEAVEHHSGVPWKTIGVQCFNFAVLMGVIYYFSKAAIVAHFKDRKDSYKELVIKAEAAKKEAEASHREAATRLTRLEESAKENVQKAKTEAEILRSRLVKEAEELTEKLKKEAKNAAQIEIEKAKNEIQTFALQQALSEAEKKLSQESSTVDQSRLQSEFIEKIQAVTQ